MKGATCACGEMRWTGTTGPRLCVACTHCGTAIGGGEPEPHAWVQAFDEFSGDPYEECSRCLRKVDVNPPPPMADLGHQLRQEQLTTQALNATVALLTRERDALVEQVQFLSRRMADGLVAMHTVTRERDEARAEVERLRTQVATWERNAAYACESPPSQCDCPGCSLARADAISRGEHDK